MKSYLTSKEAEESDEDQESAVKRLRESNHDGVLNFLSRASIANTILFWNHSSCLLRNFIFYDIGDNFISIHRFKTASS